MGPSVTSHSRLHISNPGPQQAISEANEIIITGIANDKEHSIKDDNLNNRISPYIIVIDDIYCISMLLIWLTGRR